MANYDAIIRTNYFSVTDEERFRAIMDCVVVGSDVDVFEETDDNGKKLFGFGCYGSIYGVADTEEDEVDLDDLDSLFSALQEVIDPNDAIIVTEIGNEKLRYLVAVSTVITKTEIQSVDAQNAALELVRKLLDNPDYQTQMQY